MTTIPLHIHKNYCHHWTVNDAIREIIQNYLDCNPKDIIKDPDSITIINEGFIPKECFFLGVSKKDEDSIGRFGEGLLLALLVFARNNINCRVITGNKVYKLYFEDDDFATLNIDDFDSDDTKYTYIELHCNSEYSVDKLYGVCNSLICKDEVLAETKYGQILKSGLKSNLYVNNLFICKISLKFSYNIKPNHITLDRDRRTVSEWDIKYITSKMWYDTINDDLSKADLFKDYLFDNDFDDIRYIDVSNNEINAKIKEMCNSQKRIPVYNTDMQKQYVSRGYTSSYNYGYSGGSYHSSNYGISNIYKTAVNLDSIKKKHIIKKNLSARETLIRFSETYLNDADINAKVAFDEIITLSKKWRIK